MFGLLLRLFAGKRVSVCPNAVAPPGVGKEAHFADSGVHRLVSAS
jgi:hypothetical protein